MQNFKLVPFKSISPVKFIGINNKTPFNSLIDEHKIIYFCGRNIILQNMKTYEQKVIWTNEFNTQPIKISRLINIHRENILIIILKDQNLQAYFVSILYINAHLNNYEHLSRKQREKDRVHYIKNIIYEASIQSAKLLNEGSLYSVIISGQMNNKKYYNLGLYNTQNGECCFNVDRLINKPLVESLQLNRVNYICIVRNQPYKQQIQMPKQNPLSKDNMQNQITYITKNYITVSLIQVIDIQNSQTDLKIQVQQNQIVIDIKFYQNHKRSCGFFLLSSGYVLIALIHDKGFQQFVRIDTKINKKAYQQQKNNQKNPKNKKSSDILKSNKNNQSQKLKKSNFSTINNKKISIIQTSQIQANKDQILKDKTQQYKQDYYFPSSISCSSCKIVIGYTNCSFIGIIIFSAINHQEHRFSYIDDIFQCKPHVQSIKQINFSQDGCHCSVLAKINTTISNTNNIKKQKQRNLFDEQQKKQKTIKQINDKKQIKKALFLSTQSLQSQRGANTFYLQQQQQLCDHYQLYCIDFISGMIKHQYHNQSIEQTMTCISLKGNVLITTFNYTNNTVFILMSNGSVYYYYLNLGSSLDNQYINKFNSQMGLTRDNNLKNFLSPNDIFLWQQKMKLVPFDIVCHPIMFELLLIFNDNVKFHFYNYDKIFQSHFVLNIKNCKAASYSPFGDKLALGLNGSIWVMDSYTHQIVKKVSLVIFPRSIIQQENHQPQTRSRSLSILNSLSSSKAITKIQYVNNQDIILQTGNKIISILFNYQNSIFYGITEQIDPDLLHYDAKHRLAVISNQSTVKIVRKCSINSKGKCQQLAKIQLVVTAIKLCGQIDMLFLGGANGSLFFIRFPDFFKNDNVKANSKNNKLFLFHCPIVKIQCSVNYKQLFVISKQGKIVICQMIHSDQIQKIGKDVSFVISKKIQMPLLFQNKWMFSEVDQERKTHLITKMMGNQAQVLNNQTTIIQEYRKSSEKKFNSQKQTLDRQIEQQIRQYEIKHGISQLKINITSIKDQIKRIKGKRQYQTRQLQQNIQKDLHQIFLIRQQLQSQKKRISKQNQHQRNLIFKQQSNQLNKYEGLTNMQTNQYQNMNTNSEKMYGYKSNYDKKIQQNMKEDFTDEKQYIQKYYSNIQAELYEKNNSLTLQNRNKKFKIIQITNKMKQVASRIQQIQSDFAAILRQKTRVAETSSKLQNTIKQTDKKYHGLIKKTKQIQMKLNHIRNSSQSFQIAHNNLQIQLAELMLKFEELQNKKNDTQNDFIFQHRNKFTQTQQIKNLKKKYYQLKQKRQKKFNYNVLLKNLLNGYQPESQSLFQQEYKYLNQSQLITYKVQSKKRKNIKLTYDLEKLNHLQKQNKNSILRFNNKMGEDHNKLIERYNELKKQSIRWRQKQNSLLNEISIEKNIIKHQHLFKNQAVSFLKNIDNTKNQSQIQRFSPNNSIIANKLNSTSVNFRNSTINKFNYSLHKNNSKFDESSIISLKNKTLMNFHLKKTDNNVYPALNNKNKDLVKQNLQQNSNGVKFDKNTLKPKKTLCISLHSDSNTKFITQI